MPTAIGKPYSSGGGVVGCIFQASLSSWRSIISFPGNDLSDHRSATAEQPGGGSSR